jgi:hypothetical protein
MTATLSSHASIGRNLCFVFIIVVVFSNIANAQDRPPIPSPSNATKLLAVAPDTNDATPARPVDPKAALIDELERMRARISELEAQLRANDVESSSTIATSARSGLLEVANTAPVSVVTAAPTQAGTEAKLSGTGSVVRGFTPDLRKNENRINMAILVKF